MKDVIRQIQDDTTYDPLKKVKTDEDIYKTKKASREQQLEEEIRRQLLQKKKAAAALALEESLT
jgi:hypothetical protein